MLAGICSDVPKKAITEDSKFSYCLLTWMNPTYWKYTLQRWQGQPCRIQFLVLALNSNKYSACLSQQAECPKFLDPITGDNVKYVICS